MRRLRELRRDLEYYVEQDGWVLLLAHDDDKARVHEGRKMLLRGDDTFDNRLLVDGFSILAMLPPSSVWSGELLQVAQHIIDQATPKKVDAVHHARVLEADGTMKDLRGEAHLRDALTSEFRSDHRILFRGRRSFAGHSIRQRTGGDFGAVGAAAQAGRDRRVARELAVAARLMQRFPHLPLVR